MFKVSVGGNGCTGSSSMGTSGISLLALPREVLSRIAANSGKALDAYRYLSLFS